MATKFTTATEYIANQITILRGTVANITSVGVYHNTDPNIVPTVAQFTTVSLVDGVKDPPDANSETGKIDVLSLIGPKIGAHLDLVTPGDYQRWVLIQTANEDVIRKVDVLTIT